MEQKVIKIGSSIGAVFPTYLVKKLQIKQGEPITPVEQENGDILIKRSSPSKKPGNPDLIAWAEDAVERYRPALEALKNK